MKHGLPTVPVRQRRVCAAGSWFAYPHTNPFTADGRAMVLGRFAGDRVLLLRHDLASGDEAVLAAFPLPPGPPQPVWYDLGLASDRLAVSADGALWVADLAGDGRLREVYRGRDGWTVAHLPSISADGRRLAVAETRADGSAHGLTRLRELDIDGGRWSGDLLATAMWASHFHYCPADEGWIGYCHEGDTARVGDRMWAWHRTRAPQGRMLFDQAPDAAGVRLCVGHERWCFHAAEAVTVAYGVSPHGPRGIWVVPAEGPARLASAGERDWHVNVSRDGRTAIVDTTGSLDCPGSGWSGNDGLSDLVLIDLASGRRSWLARLDEGARRFAGPRNHPFHPHPHLGPDGRLAVWNDFTPAGEPTVALVWF